MDFYVDGGGNVLRVIPENIYQGSVNANVIRFIGAFPASATVSVGFTLPTGDYMTTRPMAFAFDLSGVINESGAKYNVWEYVLGVKYDKNGNPEPDYNVTANYGTVGVQFVVTQNDEKGIPSVLGTALSSFEVLKGVPRDYEYSPADLNDVDAVVQNIFAQMAYINGLQDDINTQLATHGNDIERLNAELSTVNERLTTHDAQIYEQQTEIAYVKAQIEGLNVNLESLLGTGFEEV